MRQVGWACHGGASPTRQINTGSAVQLMLNGFALAAGMAVRQLAGLQLHGTGTSLGDPIEVGAAAGEQAVVAENLLKNTRGACMRVTHSGVDCVCLRGSVPCRPAAGWAHCGAVAAGEQVGPGSQRASLRHHGPGPPVPGAVLLAAALVLLLYSLLQLFYCCTAPACTSHARTGQSLCLVLLTTPSCYPTCRP
jgi:hypothetical protein